MAKMEPFLQAEEVASSGDAVVSVRPWAPPQAAMYPARADCLGAPASDDLGPESSDRMEPVESDGAQSDLGKCAVSGTPERGCCASARKARRPFVHP